MVPSQHECRMNVLASPAGLPAQPSQFYTRAVAAVPRYPDLQPTSFRIARDVVRGARRPFASDARALCQRLSPPLSLRQPPPPLDAAGNLILANHYSRPGFRAWWIALAISAVIPAEVHWMMTDAWTYSDALRSRTLTPLWHWLFLRLCRVYGFTPTPPMPPRPWEVEQRAAAVRAVLRHIRRTSRPLVGLAPEGADSGSGTLLPPPPGVGRFIGLMVAAGLMPIPVGVYEDQGGLCLHFGKPFPLPVEDSGPPDARDALVARAVMQAIAACLPPRLRGRFGQED